MNIRGSSDKIIQSSHSPLLYHVFLGEIILSEINHQNLEEKKKPGEIFFPSVQLCSVTVHVYFSLILSREIEGSYYLFTVYDPMAS